MRYINRHFTYLLTYYCNNRFLWALLTVLFDFKALSSKRERARDYITLITNRKSYISFRYVQKLMSLSVIGWSEVISHWSATVGWYRFHWPSRLTCYVTMYHGRNHWGVGGRVRTSPKFGRTPNFLNSFLMNIVWLCNRLHQSGSTCLIFSVEG